MAGPAGQRSTSLVKTKRLYVLTDSVTYDIFKIGLYKNLGFIKPGKFATWFENPLRSTSSLLYCFLLLLIISTFLAAYRSINVSMIEIS